ncbi:MAG: cell division protein FtsZ [Hyphomicrobiales bacterium]|nr:cell division protein FtsZ [Hyphomicrobiales bacterium]
MTINLRAPELRELKPRIMVCGVGGAGGNAVNNMIDSGLDGVDFIVANTDAQALTKSKAERIIQMGLQVTEGLGAGSKPEIGHAAAEEAMEELRDHLAGAHMVFVTAGMGGGTGTGAAPVIARIAREMGILTVGVVTKPFHFEGQRRMRVAEAGISELQKAVDTLIVIPNQNLFRVATENTTFADAFAMADQVLYSGVACITDLMVKEGLINLDFADVRAIMRDMGKAMMGTGEASGENRAIHAAEAAIANPLLDEVSMRGARGLLISITGGSDLKLYEVDEAASRIRQEVDEDANIILGATFDTSLNGIVRVSVVATGIDAPAMEQEAPFVAPAFVAKPAVNVARAAAPAAPISQPAPVAAPVPAPEPVYEEQPVEAMVIPEVALAPIAPVRQPPMANQGQIVNQVNVQPTPPRAVQQPIPQPAPAHVIETYAPASSFVPPAPVQVVRPVRMPTIDDLPPHIVRTVQVNRGEAPVEPHKKTLMERLSSFGLGRQEPVAPAAGRTQMPAAPAIPRDIAQGVEDLRRVAAAGAVPSRANHASLDPHGRSPAPAPRVSEDDEAEIPAFLRRKSH